MNIMLVIMRWDNVAVLVRWAARFAKSQGDELIVLCHTGGKAAIPASLISDQPSELESQIITDARRAISGISGLRFQLFQFENEDPVKAVIQVIEEKQVTSLLLAGNPLASEKSERWRVMERLSQFAPCETTVIDSGETDGRTCQEVLIPCVGVFQEHALELASSMAEKEDAVIHPFMVGSFMGEGSADVAMRELELQLRDAGVEINDHVKPLVDIASKSDDAIISRGNGCDLIILGNTQVRTLQRLRGGGLTPAQEPLRPKTALAAIRRRRTTTLNAASQTAAAFMKWLPKLKPNDRVNIFDRLQDGSRLSFDFCTMLALSASIASLGLLQNSAAIVIGAMLVAPLMTPLVGCGFALVQGNVRLYGKSLRAAGIGIASALVLSYLIGIATRNFPITPELMARGGPNLLDLAIAFLSGMAGAYAMSRPNLIGSIVGVAIATALVPPLATIGISAAQGEWELTFGSAELFITNVVAIILGTATVFFVVGLRVKTGQFSTKRWTRRPFLVLILAFIALTIPLAQNLMERLGEGESQALMFPASELVRQDIEKRVADEPGVTLYVIARPGTDPDSLIRITLLSATPISKTLEKDLIDTVRKHMGEDVIVQIAVMDAQMSEHAPAKTEE